MTPTHPILTEAAFKKQAKVLPFIKPKSMKPKGGKKGKGKGGKGC